MEEVPELFQKQDELKIATNELNGDIIGNDYLCHNEYDYSLKYCLINNGIMTSRLFLAVTVLGVFTFSVYAQNNETEFEEFRRQRENMMTDFEQQREKEFEEFKARYHSAFEEFRQNCLRLLEEEDRTVDLMASDDGIRIEPLKMAPAPLKVVSTSAEQKRILREDIESVKTMQPEDLVPLLSDAKDTVIRMQQAAETMESIVAGMNADAVEDEATVMPVSTDVVLEPLDPEYFSSLPDVDKAGAVEPEVKVTGSVGAEPAEPAASVNASVPSGTPTEYVRISSPFGTRVHPITHKRHTHKGVDLAAPRNTPIYATADGTVTFSGRNGGYGNFVKINHRNGYKTAYAHMNSIVVKKGKAVRKGDLIGYVGSTGASTGNHLHYEVYYNDKLIDPETTL